MLDDVERDHPELRVVRMRTSLVFQRAAASEVHRLFLGSLMPWHLPRLLRFVPGAGRLVFQATHADDIAERVRAGPPRDVTGAFNVAAEPTLTMRRIAEAVAGRVVPVTDQRTAHGRLRLVRGADPTVRAGVARHGVAGPADGHQPRPTGAGVDGTHQRCCRLDRTAERHRRRRRLSDTRASAAYRRVGFSPRTTYHGALGGVEHRHPCGATARGSSRRFTAMRLRMIAAATTAVVVGSSWTVVSATTGPTTPGTGPQADRAADRWVVVRVRLRVRHR